ncbi:integrator complex subunit 8-like [Argonauta hians]
MSECVMSPSGRPSMGPVTLPAVAWFEFLLDETLIEKHLKEPNPDPTASQMIVHFMQQAEQHSNTAAMTPSSSHGKTPDGNHGNHINAADTKLEDIPEMKPAGFNKKVKALKILALKVAAFLQWDLEVLSKSIPLTMIQTLLLELVRTCVGSGSIEKVNTIQDYNTLSDEAAFAMQLFHRWSIETVVLDTFPNRPQKTSFVSVPGVQETMFTLAGINESLVRLLKDQIKSSVENLQTFLQSMRPLKVPTLSYFCVPTEVSDPMENLSQQCVTVSADEFKTQVSYSLGMYFFHLEEYSEAYEMFKITEESFVPRGYYCRVNADHLKGYLVACRNMVSVSLPSSYTMSHFERADLSKSKNYEGLIDVLMEDNTKRELSREYRHQLFEEISRKPASEVGMLSFQVNACNIVSEVLDGKGVISAFMDEMRNEGQKGAEFLLSVLSCAIKTASDPQKEYLKSFTGYLAQLLPRETKFVALLTKTEVYSHFSETERLEMLNFEDRQDGFCEEISCDYGFTSYPDCVSGVSEAERHILYECNPQKVEDLIIKLTQKWGRHPNQIMALTDWQVPKPLRQMLESMPSSMQQTYAYILVGKSRHCLKLKAYNIARDLLTSAMMAIKDYNFALTKHHQYQMLLVDLLQADSSVCSNDKLHQLANKAKTCLNTVRSGQDTPPTPEVVEQAAVFLLNVKDWEYLSNMEGSGNGFIEVSLLLARACKEVNGTKAARKPPRDFWEATGNIFSDSMSQKRSITGRGETMIYRNNSLAIMSKESFGQFIKKIKEPAILSFLISCLTKMYNILKDNIGSEIFSNYLAIWPSSLNNTSAMDTAALAECVTLLMQHALSLDPLNPSWLRTQADIHFAHNQYSSAMKYYLEAGLASSNYFSIPVPNPIYDEQVYRKMIKCCSYLQCHTQVAILCQFLEAVDYTTAFKALQETTIYDAHDTYYYYIWDLSILEFLSHLHAKRGEVVKKQQVMKSLGQVDLNVCNPEDILHEATQHRKNNFLRSLAKLYL